MDEMITHADGCHDWGPKHYYCAMRELARLQVQLASAAAKIRDYEQKCAELSDRVRCLEHDLYGGSK